ncbi:MAG TPA: copper amine oxidase N-terminal domain-containing protein [Candidatus Tyrphobacter sp.]
MKRITAIAAALVFAAAAILTQSTTSAQQNITVLIDGSPMGFPDQPPIDQGGRVFVPMRAIFERLGATVVYDNGTINATRGPRTISLQIGSASATIDGQPAQLDAPPFVTGGQRTMVPLRFVAQALGANVAWSEANTTVYIRTNGMGAPGYNNGGYTGGPAPPYRPGTSQPHPGPIWADAGHQLLHRPYPWGLTSRPYPLINASFRLPVQPYTMRIMLDGRNVTDIAKVTMMGFEFTPAYPLHAGTHTVRVFGETQNGMPISDGWSFTVTSM